jgi:hypothetical protein
MPWISKETPSPFDKQPIEGQTSRILLSIILFLLFGRTQDISIRAEHAAVALFGANNCLTMGTLVEELTVGQSHMTK